MLKYLCNIYDPNREDAKLEILASFGQSKQDAWHQRLRWLSDKIIGEPQPTSYYTVEQLKSFGMVGVYVEVEET